MVSSSFDVCTLTVRVKEHEIESDSDKSNESAKDEWENVS